LQTAEGTDLHAFYRGMIQLRTSSKALVGNNIRPVAMDAERKLLAYYRWADDGSEHVIVVVNFGITLQYLDVHFPVGGLWHEWVYNYDRETPEGMATIEVPGSGGKVFVLR